MPETWGNYGVDYPNSPTWYYLYRSDYPADATGYWFEPEKTIWCDFPRWRSPVTMPFEAARTFGKARTARIGRVQDATPLDAWNEGCRLGASIPWEKHIPELQKQCRLLLKRIWDAEHPRDLWAGNPWTWVIETERSKA